MGQTTYQPVLVNIVCIRTLITTRTVGAFPVVRTRKRLISVESRVPAKKGQLSSAILTITRSRSRTLYNTPGKLKQVVQAYGRALQKVSYCCYPPAPGLFLGVHERAQAPIVRQSVATRHNFERVEVEGLIVSRQREQLLVGHQTLQSAWLHLIPREALDSGRHPSQNQSHGAATEPQPAISNTVQDLSIVPESVCGQQENTHVMISNAIPMPQGHRRASGDCPETYSQR